jgi:UDP-glucose 4,6-dehydratase
MILLLGGSGYIGSAFYAELAAQRLDFKAPTRFKLDYTNAREFDLYLRLHSPELVINAAGYIGKPNVDACEAHKDHTFDGNVILPLALVRSCSMHGIPLAHLSSGCIFNGDGVYNDDSPPNFTFKHPPCSYYTGTKAMAEEMLLNFDNVYLWRLRLPFDEFDSERNYISKLIRYPKLLVATNSLSHRGDFVKTCLELWRLKAPFGPYNITNPGAVNTLEVTEMIREKLLPDRRFEYFESEEEFRKVAPAPRSNCVLKSDRLANLGIKMRTTKEAITQSLDAWLWQLDQANHLRLAGQTEMGFQRSVSQP